MQIARLLLLACCLFFIAHCFAQDSVAFHYASQITAEDVKPYLYVLASDSFEGRETVKTGQKKAAKFIASHFEKLKLKPASHGTYLQEISLSTKANMGKNFLLNERFYLFMEDYFYPPDQVDSLFKIDTIAFVGYGVSDEDYDDYRNINVSRKPVLFFEGEPKNKKRQSWIEKNKLHLSWQEGLEKKLTVAKEKGALFAAIITDSLEQIIDRYTYGNQPPISSSIPFVFIERIASKSFFAEADDEIAEKAKRKIDKKLKPQSFVSVTHSQLPFIKNTDLLRGENVTGFLEGTDKKDELIVITAHYDHLGKNDSLIYHGADDNGSGTTAVMELAKVFSKAAEERHRPRRSILFMPVSGEEKGLLGSKYYVSHPLFPLAETVADLNIDMIGRTDQKHDSMGVRNYIYIIGSDKLSTELHHINEHVDSTYTHLDFDYTFNRPEDPNRFYYRSDHYNFAKNNIPVIFYFNGVHKDYHKPTDTIDKIQFDLLAKRAQLVFLTAWELANREQRIKVDVKSDMPEKR